MSRSGSPPTADARRGTSRWLGSGRLVDVARIRFPIRIGPRSRWVVRLSTARPETSHVDLDDGSDAMLDVHFGRLRFRTPVANIASWRIEGPFRWITAIGVRRSIRHGDASFAGSAHGGVRIDFKERVPWGFLRVPAIYVAVDDLAGLAGELARRGIAGTDARARLVR
jgi:hypothetical protein